MKIRDVVALTMPNREAMKAAMATKAVAAPAPARFFLANSNMLWRLPLGSKLPDGVGMSTTPVNDSSNSSHVILTWPRAGSLRYTCSPRNPSSTTKCSMFQWMMQGNVPWSLRCSGDVL